MLDHLGPGTFSTSIYALGAVSVLSLVQLIIADVTGIARKHVPGTAISGDHSDFLFRASRTVSNTNESIAIYVCALLFCIFGAASAELTAYAAWGYVVARVAYAACYYSDYRTLRSVCFALSLLSILALILVGCLT